MNKPFILALAAFATASGLASPSGLTPDQIIKIKKAGKVVIPTYIPAGFKLVSCSAEVGSYNLVYTEPSGGVLIIEMASEGIGDIVLGGDADKKTLKMFKGKVSNGTFGKKDLYVATAKGYLAFATSWVDLGKKAKPRFFCVIGHQMSVELGAQVWKGLKYLN